VPREIGGVRLENLIISMATVLQRHGSPELARAITDHYLTALQFAQSADSVRSVLAGARRIAAAGMRHDFRLRSLRGAGHG